MRLPRWRPEEITFRLDDPMTEATVWTFTVFAPGCTLHVMVNAGTESEDRKVVTFSGVHMHGAAPNDIGVANLRAMGAGFAR
jgi:hypothetical protein